MTIKEIISADIKTAMKAGDAAKLTVLRGLSSSFSNKAIEKRAKTGKEEVLTDEEMLAVVMSEAKKRKDAMTLYTEGGRADLAANEAAELTIIQTYLPKQLDQAATEAAVDKIIAAAAVKEFGPVMKDVMKELKGKADAALVTELVKKKLGA